MSISKPMDRDRIGVGGYPFAPLPACPPYVEPHRLIAELDAWVSSPAMRALVAASGWSWPAGDVHEVVSDLASRSNAWDFRAGGERHGLTERNDAFARLGFSEDFVMDVATALGLAGTAEPEGAYSHVVVLGGMVRACINRSREAARLREHLGIESVVVLTAHRPVPGSERSDAVAAGWPRITLESEAAEAAARDAFGASLDPSLTVEEWWNGDDSSADVSVEEIAEQRRRRSWMVREYSTSWGSLDVVVAPSRDPATRRANTSDQLRFWAERKGIHSRHRVLLVTTAHYVPFQHFEAVRVLGVGRACGVVTTGTPWTPSGGRRGAPYLQEIRAALCSADRLLDELDAVD